MKKLVVNVALTLSQFVRDEDVKELSETSKGELQQAAEEFLKNNCGSDVELAVSEFDYKIIDMVEKLG